jgi:hypothetical protein
MANNPPILKIPPRCNCTSLDVSVGETISFYALAEDPDGNGLTYDWQSSSPAAQVIVNNSGSGSTAILNTNGINPRLAVPVKVSLRVSDGNGGEVTGDVTVVVIPKAASASREAALPIPSPNHSPKLEALSVSKTSVEAGDSVSFWAFVTDPDGDQPLFFDWKSSAGEILNKGESAILNTIINPTPTNIIVVLTVSDGHGGTTSQRVFISVKTNSTKLTDQ